jgi:hypothetical protein
MTFVNSGANAIRDLFNTALTDAELGTDGTASLSSDTALGTRVVATDLSVTNSVADKQVNMDYNLTSTLGNGSVMAEFGTFNAADVLFSRHAFAALTKESTEQWQISVIYKINN